MSVKNRRLKIVTFTLNGTEYECQLTSWTLDPGVKDGNRVYTYCSDTANNSFIEETDDEPVLKLKFVSDWASGGISDLLWANPNTVVPFVLDHHPDITGEHVRFAGNALVKPAPVGGDSRTTELTEVDLLIVGSLAAGTLVYSRIG